MFAKTQTSFQPREAHHLEDTGLSLSLVLDLILKYTYFEGAMTLAKLMERDIEVHTQAVDRPFLSGRAVRGRSA